MTQFPFHDAISNANQTIFKTATNTLADMNSSKLLTPEPNSNKFSAKLQLDEKQQKSLLRTEMKMSPVERSYCHRVFQFDQTSVSKQRWLDLTDGQVPIDEP